MTPPPAREIDLKLKASIPSQPDVEETSYPSLSSFLV